MDKKMIKFDDTEIEKKKNKFHLHKRPISRNNIDINKIVVSNGKKVSFGKKNLKGYKYAKKIRHS